MTQRGRLTEWNDDRGFGFITPLEGGSRVFVHISAFQHGNRRPAESDLVTYAVGPDDRGRMRATEVRFLVQARPSGQIVPKRNNAPSPRLGLLVLVSVVLVLVAGVVGIALATAGLLRDSATSQPFSARVADATTTPAPALEDPPAAAIVEPPKTLKERNPGLSTPAAGATEKPPLARSAAPSDDAIANAFRDGTSGAEVTGAGTVDRVLSDDNEGSRHQRFILRLASGQTLLVAHNIDIAPRLVDLNVGDSVAFKGEYEWNAQGGVIHWTHHDPGGTHVAGWLKHNGQTSQ